MHKYTLKGSPLFFETQTNVFFPTGTSDLLINACASSLLFPKKILDIGCGCGIVGISLARLGLCDGPLFASDISADAVELARKNAQKMSVSCIARCGSLFEPWTGEKFDIIVDDVAGISDDIAKISPWYPPGVDCDAGRDGTKWIVQIIEQSKKYMAEEGSLIFPVLSLSNKEKIISALKDVYPNYKIIAQKDWLLPDEIVVRPDIFMPLINDGSISCQEKFGKWIWSTFIYKALM